MPTLLDFQQVIKQVYDEAANRLRVDTGATINLSGEMEVAIDAASGDNIAISDGVDTLAVNADGSINVVMSGSISATVALDAFTKVPADNAIAVGTEDGTQTGIKHALTVGSDLRLRVKDIGLPIALGQTTMANSTSVVLASDQAAINTRILEAFSVTPDNVQLVGSIDGTKTGTKYGYVNNLRQQILSTHDREQDITYADFGTKNQRVTQVDYNSLTFPGFIARKQISYTLVGNFYRLDSINWTII